MKSLSDLKRPWFMSPAMWFAFLLRSDIRGGLPPTGLETQMNFVAWWLCFGRKEYSEVWAYQECHISIAMEKIKGDNNIIFPRLLWYIHGFEKIKENFPLRHEEEMAKFLCWYRIYGPKIFDFAPELPPEFLIQTEKFCDRPPWNQIKFQVPRIAAALIELGGQDVQEFFDFGRASSNIFMDFCLHGGWRNFVPPTPSVCVAESTHPHLAIPDIFKQSHQDIYDISINVVGYARGELGVGEDIRMVSLALDSINIHHTIIDVSDFLTSARKNDSFIVRNSSAMPVHHITIYCMPIFDLARVYLEFGDKFFKNQYKIGYFPWELPEFPDGWHNIYDLIDEIWAPSAFTAQAFVDCTKKPVYVMPPAVSLPPISLHSTKEFTRRDEEIFVFIYPFDPNSHLSRKNPLALVRAFRKAFNKKNNAVALLLRINGDPRGHPGWKELEDAASADSRIHIWSETLDRPDALGILASCDCLVSPHRAEGFGRNIAEAILLGLPVLATGFSGNVDFMESEELIAWTPRKLAPGEYPFGDGLWWAEPSVDDLAKKMRSVCRQKVEAQNDSPAPNSRKQRFELRHAPLGVGRRYAMRLQAIMTHSCERFTSGSERGRR